MKIKIKELGIEIVYKKWDKSYKELLKNIPKGYRLMKTSEIFKIIELNLLDKITKEKIVWIYLEQLPIDTKNKWARVRYRDRDLDLCAGYGDLANTNSDGRVIFVKKK